MMWVKVYRKVFAIRYDVLAKQEGGLEEFRRVAQQILFREAREAGSKLVEHDIEDFEHDATVERIDENSAYVNLFYLIEDDAKAMMFRLDTEVGGS